MKSDNADKNDAKWNEELTKRSEKWRTKKKNK